ncbi:hypothetical protein NIASO_02110 [Niabella soli DSM 19437]|uniref:Uncharacterized protein n=1 Tax=Niabella soli DSM 19437 TaxID=929713 RepID=W0F5L5_9BACT|nr:hypothetical protein NIASO_02110 [Niabella soli DSM 19437]
MYRKIYTEKNPLNLNWIMPAQEEKKFIVPRNAGGF